MSILSNNITMLVILLVIACIALGFIGYDKFAPNQNGTDVSYTDVSVHEAKDIFDKGDVFLLDVRTESEFNSGHLEGAVNIEVSQLGTRLNEAPADKVILVYCRTGVRSVRASKTLVNAGYTDVYNMKGGIMAWMSAGYPYVS
ncbi:rhodanese-like domain-containing protein [Methanococcoides burtonii]|uniref:Rhodanese-like protein n=1 Tax=Methanococcoides burtonii (strain DSM 6242 / NBRC 107633 / OCM 468 / ACE-M) TaxID=259564 RepID=Q12VR2_METBU|nr:rhodanese-like domain-containing protein [Methanococcoides burtonii]ABE52464.1 Rhodanese-like protein [Methanococcoides burtonii DSM 6242]